MKRYCLLASFLLAVPLAWGQDAPAELKKLEGTWLPVLAELAGQKFPEDRLKSLKLVVAGDRYTVTVGDVLDQGKVKVDPASKPRSMDIVGEQGPNKGKTYQAIYEWKEDSLRVCYDLSGKERPTEFATRKGSLLFLVTYERAKK